MIANLDDFYHKVFMLISSLIEVYEYDLARELYASLRVSQSQFEVFGECKKFLRALKKSTAIKKLRSKKNVKELEDFILNHM